MVFSSEPFIKLVEMVLVVTAVIADLMLCTNWFKEVLTKRYNIRNRVILLLVFGGITIYGTYSGLKVHDAIINIRDLGPMVAGLIGGPLLGLGVGLIGGIHRYFLGGFTALPCSIATVCAGIFSGLVFRLRRGELININEAVIFAVGIESLHMLLILLLTHPFSAALIVVRETIIPMIIANALGLVIFILIFKHGIEEIRASQERDRLIAIIKRKDLA